MNQSSPVKYLGVCLAVSAASSVVELIKLSDKLNDEIPLGSAGLSRLPSTHSLNSGPFLPLELHWGILGTKHQKSPIMVRGGCFREEAVCFCFSREPPVTKTSQGSHIINSNNSSFREINPQCYFVHKRIASTMLGTTKLIL